MQHLMFVVTSLLALVSVTAVYGVPSTIRLQNDKVFLELDGAFGYAITGFGPIGGDNLINHHDEGRECQISLYAGPNPYNPDNKCTGKWRQSWPWNPIGAGDVYGNHGAVVSYNQTSNETMTLITRPLQWACDAVACECLFRKVITLEGSMAVVEAQLLNNRSDHKDYGPFGQELPALYTISTLGTLVTYNGTAPFSNAPLVYPATPAPQPPWVPGVSAATEGWAAFVNGSGTGVGLVHAGLTKFNMGFHGNKGPGSPTTDDTGYLAPYATVDLVWNSSFTYTSYLVYGSVNDIRQVAYNEHKNYIARHGPSPALNISFNPPHLNAIPPQNAVRTTHSSILLQPQTHLVFPPTSPWPSQRQIHLHFTNPVPCSDLSIAVTHQDPNTPPGQPHPILHSLPTSFQPLAPENAISNTCTTILQSPTPSQSLPRLVLFTSTTADLLAIQ